MNKIIDVAAAAIHGENGILLALRPAHLHQGNKWEFPGGKCEPGETPEQALIRELKEELDIGATSYSPLITLTHHYSEKSVRLHVFDVWSFKGQPAGKENQELRWVKKEELRHYTFPDANYPIVSALSLPSTCVITPELSAFHNGVNGLLNFVDKNLSQGRTLFQLRLHESIDTEFLSIAETLIHRIGAHNGILMLNRHPEVIHQLSIALTGGLNHIGWHLSRQTLKSFSVEALNATRPAWLSMSVHSADDVALIKHYKPGFVFISPVLPTATHPGAPVLGWHEFTKLVEHVNCPAYALGGLTMDGLATAKRWGGQGIAGIHCFM